MKKGLLWSGCFTALWLLITPAQAVDMQNATEVSEETVERVQNEKDVSMVDAAEKGDWENVKKLLEDGADVNFQRFKPEWFPEARTAFMYVVQSGNAEMVRLFLDYGANVNIKDFWSCNALFYAVCKEENIEIIKAHKPNLEVVKLLLEKGANVNEISFSALTVLDCANLQQNDELIELLEGYDAKPASAFLKLSMPAKEIISD